MKKCISKRKLKRAKILMSVEIDIGMYIGVSEEEQKEQLSIITRNYVNSLGDKEIKIDKIEILDGV